MKRVCPMSSPSIIEELFTNDDLRSRLLLFVTPRELVILASVAKIFHETMDSIPMKNYFTLRLEKVGKANISTSPYLEFTRWAAGALALSKSHEKEIQEQIIDSKYSRHIDEKMEDEDLLRKLKKADYDTAISLYEADLLALQKAEEKLFAMPWEICSEAICLDFIARVSHKQGTLDYPLAILKEEVPKFTHKMLSAAAKKLVDRSDQSAL